jgi:hypothetical protein
MGVIASWGSRIMAIDGKPARRLHFVAAPLPGLGVVESPMSRTLEEAAWAWMLANATPPEDTPLDDGP